MISTKDGNTTECRLGLLCIVDLFPPSASRQISLPPIQLHNEPSSSPDEKDCRDVSTQMMCKKKQLPLWVVHHCLYCSCDVARCRAPVRAWRESARVEAADAPSRRSAFKEALDRRAEDFLVRRCPAFKSRFAACKVSLDTLPFFGGFRSTPARRAFERPIAMACLAERAPCFPSRI